MAYIFDKINKIITVEIPTVVVTIQEILNVIRDYEDELINLEEPQIVSAAGKEDLGEGVKVGITITLLNNWRIAFEERSPPNYIQCKISGGNLVAEHVDGPIYPTAYTQIVLTASSSATINAGDSEAIADAIWNEVIGEHIETGSTGEALDNVSAGASPNTIAEAVWDKTLSEHDAPGTFGEKISKKLLTVAKLIGLK